jgi:hypothetical protein
MPSFQGSGTSRSPGGGPCPGQSQVAPLGLRVPGVSTPTQHPVFFAAFAASREPLPKRSTRDGEGGGAEKNGVWPQPRCGCTALGYRTQGRPRSSANPGLTSSTPLALAGCGPDHLNAPSAPSREALTAWLSRPSNRDVLWPRWGWVSMGVVGPTADAVGYPLSVLRTWNPRPSSTLQLQALSRWLRA